ncbi:MAG: hypothetical protein D6679_07430 [Candidatus Hydrogenedentota bacterium]|nr:MAG: hypothetical protein D6679_07430 [Candidatus Hydrogenedentota bacterium]
MTPPSFDNARSTDQTTDKMRTNAGRAIDIVGRVLFGLSLLFFLTRFATLFHQIPSIRLTATNLLFFSLAVLLATSCVALTVTVSTLFYSAGAPPITFGRCYEIVGISQIAKYIPGNIFQHIGQVALAIKKRIPGEVSVLAIGMQTFIIVLSGGSLILAGILSGYFSAGRLLPFLSSFKEFGLPLFLAGGVGAAVFAALLPRVRGWFLARRAFCSPLRLISAFLLYWIVFGLYGIISSLLLALLSGSHVPLRWYDFSWGFAAAWLAGFLVPGAPAGLGIRETVFLLLYEKTLGQGTTLALAVLLRVVSALGDLITFLIASRKGGVRAAESVS